MTSSDSVVQKHSDACRTISPKKKATPPATVSNSNATRAASQGMSSAEVAQASTISPCSRRPTRRSANSWPASCFPMAPDWCFRERAGRQLCENTHAKLLRELGFDAVTHGFRSSFRDYAAEQTHMPHAVMEAALAHAIKSDAEAGYARSDLFEKRRELMESWAQYLGRETEV